MAETWATKAPADVRDYTWTPRVGIDVASASFSVTSGTATVAYETCDDTITVTVTGGEAGVVQVIAGSAVLDSGETLTEVFIVPVEVNTVRHSDTAADVIAFALRKIVGVGETAEAAESQDALELLNGMVALWRDEGVDVGLTLPLESSSDLDIRDEFVLALKFNLRVLAHGTYNEPLSPLDAQMAVEAKRAAMVKLMDRGELAFENAILRRRPIGSLDEL